jgi:hypothetical protein
MQSQQRKQTLPNSLYCGLHAIEFGAVARHNLIGFNFAAIKYFIIIIIIIIIIIYTVNRK